MLRKFMTSLVVALAALALMIPVVLAAPPVPGGQPNKPNLPGPAGNADKTKTPVAGANRHAYFGTVVTITDNLLVLDIKKGDDLTVTVTTTTRIALPGLKSATLADIMVGDRVAVNGLPGVGMFTAKRIGVAPGKPAIQHRVGVVKEYVAGTSLTITDVQGNDLTFALTADTVIRSGQQTVDLAVGDRVTVIARRVPATNVFTATAVVVHDKP